MNTIIIDGNNLLHKVPSFKKMFGSSPDNARRALVAAVKGRIKNKVKIIFVFDGHSNERMPNVIYSGTKTADSVIRKYIEDHYNKYSIKVVSSDNEITSLARVCACEVSSSENFWNEINSGSPAKGRNINQLYIYDKEKPEGMSRKELNEYLKHFT